MASSVVLLLLVSAAALKTTVAAGIATVVHTIPAHTGYQNLLSQPVAFGQQGPYSPGPAPSHQSIVTHGETMPPAYSPNYTQPAKPSY
ncbi:hypothetical protein DNTS_022972 [Danionella cerebrum]|uniref:Uncharacterized protein n=1 Tax=Danionella cerebrum TaxID=2873325 RepID=A0A553RHF6_9TELE|nr:hypothetical protein DNTS_022972 [Danionella translucida]